MGIGGLKANKSALLQDIYKAVGFDKAIGRAAKGVEQDLNAAESVLVKGGTQTHHAEELKALEGDKEAYAAKVNELRQSDAERIGLKADENGSYGSAGLNMFGIKGEDYDAGLGEGKDLIADAIAKRREALAKGGVGGVYNASNDAVGTGLSLAKEYYLGGTKMENAKHIAGTYMAGAVGARLLSGGTPVTNSNGERDIVGLPFI